MIVYWFYDDEFFFYVFQNKIFILRLCWKKIYFV